MHPTALFTTALFTTALFTAVLFGCTQAPPPSDVPIGARSEPEQLAALEDALLSDPAAALALCAELTAPNARERCARLRTRPHLWQPRADGGPTLPSVYADTPPLAEPCGTHPQPRACWSRYAYGRAAVGDMNAAAGACAAIEAGAWREECMFQAGESTVERRRAGGYADGLALCALAGRFQQDCLSHSISLLAEGAPSAPDGDWAATIAAADAVTQAWAPIDPDQGARWREQLWAEALLYAYDHTLLLSGHPLDTLPSDATPHVRAAVAWRLLVLNAPTDHDLTGWGEQLQQALASRAPTTREDAPRRALTSIPPLAPPTGPETQSWLGVSRRLNSPDPVADGMVCLLEAAARQPGSRALLEEGATHPTGSPVQETASRLLRVLGPQLPVD